MAIPEETAKSKILIVEDEAIIGLDLKIRLTNWGYTISDHLFSAEKALELIEQDPPDLILMDIILQGKMDGIEAAEIIRHRWGIPVIFITAYADMERIRRARLTYPFGYLIKPCRDRDLQITIEMALYIAKVDQEREKAEKALRENEERYRQLFSTIQDAIIIIDWETNQFLDCNEAVEALYGYSREEFLRLRHSDITTEPELSSETLKQVYQGNLKHISIRWHRKKDGTVFPAEILGGHFKLAGRELVYGVVRDITERRKGEEELKIRSMLLDQVSDSVVLHDLEGRILYANEAAHTMRGYSKEELMAMNLQILAVPQTAALIMSRIADLIEKGVAVFETDNVRKDGTVLPLEIHARLVDYQGQKAILAVGRDLSERRRVEKDLRDSEEKYRTLFDHTGTAIIIVEEDRTISLANSEFVKLSGYSKAEIEGRKKSEDFALPEDWDRLLNYHTLRRQNPLGAPREYESKLVDKQGIVKQTYNTVSLIPGSGKSIVSFNDITELKRAQEALRASEENYRLIADNSRDWIYLINPDLTFQYLSPSCERITGHPPQAFFHNPRLLLEVTHPEDRERLKAHLNLVRNETGSQNLEFRLINKAGDTLWISHSCFPVYNDQGLYVGRSGTNRDISVRKKTELALLDSEERYRSLFELSSSVVVVHIDEKIVLINPAGVTLLGGKSIDDILGLNLIDQFFLPEYRDIARERGRLITETGRTPPFREYRFRRLDGEIIDVEATGKAITYKGEKAVLSIYYDITKRKQAEAEIHNLNAELESRVRERTLQLESTNKELEGFSYSISHDLRAPLRHLTGFVNLLNKQLDGRLDGKSRHYLEVISESAVKMGKLIDDILSFSRMGRQEIRRSQIDLGTLIRDIIKEMEPDWRNRNIDWSIASLPEVVGDLPMLKMVLENLLANALKFTRMKSPAKIEIGTLRTPPHETAVYVRDNGVGFDMAYQEKLFNLFQRLHHEKDFEGTGLGLANVRRIISRHGGRTWAESNLGLGATFYFSLPLRKRKG